MSLSVDKFQSLLSQLGFTPVRYFIVRKRCVYVEIVSVNDGSFFLLSIPSSYELFVKKGEGVFKIKPLSMDAASNLEEAVEDTRHDIPKEFAVNPDNLDLEMKYNEIELPHDTVIGSEGNTVNKLIQSYKRPISLKNLDKDDMAIVREMVRQLQRIRFCVENLPYKVAVFHKKYFCVLVSSQSTPLVFYIKHLLPNRKRRLVPCGDLATFYKKGEGILQDIHQIQTGIQKVVNKNLDMLSKNLRSLFDQKDSILPYCDLVQAEKVKLQQYILSFQNLLPGILDSEKEVYRKLTALDSQRKDVNYSLSRDTDMSHIRSKLEAENASIQKVKKEIIGNISGLKERLENLTLIVDKILFDNTVMLDTITRNFSELQELFNRTQH